MKKVILVVVGLMCSLMVGKVQADCTGTIFSDVNEASVGYQFCDYIERFSVLGITTGYPDGTFRPSNYPTRGQMAAFFMRAIDNVVQSQIRVMDNNDQYLGNLIGVGEVLVIYLPSLKRMIHIDFVSGEVYGAYGIWYTSTDCSGIGYSEPITMYRICVNNGKYYAGAVTESVKKYNNSYRNFSGDCIINSFSSEIDSIPVDEVTLPFTVPVAIPIRFD
jgi:hypothetical protein